MLKGGYQLLNFRDICKLSLDEIRSSYQQKYEIQSGTQEFTIAKNVISCGKPILLSNLRHTNEDGADTTNNLYMSTETNDDGSYYKAIGFVLFEGEITTLSFEYITGSNSIEIYYTSYA